MAHCGISVTMDKCLSRLTSHLFETKKENLEKNENLPLLPLSQKTIISSFSLILRNFSNDRKWP
jgi:hypothetical protein